MIFRQLFDEKSNTLTYLLGDPASGKALLIDPVLGQETRDLELLSQLNLRLSWVLETHEHADHITSANKLRTLTGCALATPDSGESMGADRYLGHSEYLTCGAIELEVRHTPGHTSGSASYVAATLCSFAAVAVRTFKGAMPRPFTPPYTRRSSPCRERPECSPDTTTTATARAASPRSKPTTHAWVQGETWRPL